MIIFALAITVVCSAQSNQTESISITTYYPAPYGVYTTLQLFPTNSFAPGSDCEQEGETLYSENAHEVIVCQGSPAKWKILGSAMNAMKVFAGQTSPDQCSGTLNATLELCSDTFFQDIVFNESFSKPPHVMVLMERIPDPDHVPACAANETDEMVAYPEAINETGFRIVAGGSPWGSACGVYNNTWMRAKVKWLAIGE